MATMGKYGKAYSLKKFREFPEWSEAVENARTERQIGADGKESDGVRVLTDDDYLYLQENYVVTDGIFKDENIIFALVTPQWLAYCQETLEFEIPTFVLPGETAASPA